jgi:heme/copper-type cytochrome/quinol oxidase subunit 2
MVLDEDLKIGQLRLLEVNKRTLLPVKTNLRLLVTSDDVLHSWAVPALGVKLDACPGRLNQSSLFIKREGIFYGQCSEICGVNHAFMPIVIKAVNSDEFLDWFGKGFSATRINRLAEYEAFGRAIQEFIKNNPDSPHIKIAEAILYPSKRATGRG